MEFVVQLARVTRDGWAPLQGFETQQMIHCAPHMRNERLNIFTLLPSSYLITVLGNLQVCRHARAGAEVS